MTIQGQAEGGRRPHRPQTAVGGAGVAGPADPQDLTGVWFPRLAVRDLDGCEMALPAGLPGEWTVVIVAFRREQQDLVDSWVPWLEQRAAADSRLGFVELPAIGLRWQPARPVIDGGMAAAIPDQKTRRRNLTVYTDIRRITVPLGITDRNSPRANAYAERFVLTARTEITDQMLIFGERHLRTILARYEAHYNGRRPHRSRQLQPPRPDHPPADLSKKRIQRRPLLGGLINEYERAA